MKFSSGFLKRFNSRFKKGGLSKKQKISLLILVFILLAGGLVLKNRLASRADTTSGITNTAVLTYTNSQGQATSVPSNTVTTQLAHVFQGFVKDNSSNPISGATVSTCKWTNSNSSGSCLKMITDKTTDSTGFYKIDEPLEEGAYSFNYNPPSGSTNLLATSHYQYITLGTSYSYDANISKPVFSGRIYYNGFMKASNSPAILAGAVCSFQGSTFSTTSDTDGNFKIYTENMGNLQYNVAYTVNCSKTGYLAKAGYTQGKDNPSITLTSGSTVYTLVNMIDADTPGLINLSAKDDTGKIFDSVWYISLSRQNGGSNWYSYNGTTTATISKLPYGTYDIIFYQFTGYAPSNKKTITIDAQHLVGDATNTVLSRSASVTGSITSTDSINSLINTADDPLVAQLFDTSTPPKLINTVRSTNSISEGTRYNMASNVPVGTYNLKISARKHLDRSQSITISAPTDKKTLDFTQVTGKGLDSGCSLEGTVKDAAGNSIDFAKLELLGADGTTAIKTLNDIPYTFKTSMSMYYQKGAYEFSRNVTAGTYNIKVTAYGYAEQKQAVACATNGNIVTTDFTLAPPGSAPAPQMALTQIVQPVVATSSIAVTNVTSTGTTDRVMAMDSSTNLPVDSSQTGLPTTISGTIIDDTGNPVPSVEVTLSDGAKQLAKFKTDIDGKYNYSSDQISKDNKYTVKAENGSVYSENNITATDGAKYENIEAQKLNFFQRAWLKIKNFFKRK